MAATAHSLRDGAITFSSISLVVAGMAILDENVRQLFVRLVNGDVQIAWSISDVRAHQFVGPIMDVIGRDHSEMATFAAIGARSWSTFSRNAATGSPHRREKEACRG